MIIRSIHLNNFRNYGRLDLDVGPSVNIIYGFNAQGKTNIIEAINVCSCLASHRTSKDRVMIRSGCEEYEISIDLSDNIDNMETSLYCSYLTEKSELNRFSTPKRILKQDNIEIKRAAEYIGICNTVIFAPEDLNMIKGAPSSRRRFLNLLISKTSPTYFDLLNRYNKLLDQKNATLKSMRNGKRDDVALDFWDYPLSDISAEIVIFRYRFACLLNSMASDNHLKISDNKEKFSLRYETISGSCELIEGFLKENGLLDVFLHGNVSEAIYARIKAMLSEHLYARFKAMRQNDCERGNTGIGIHRDDLDMMLNDISMKECASQGQVRSAALSLKLSELEIIRRYCRTSPILLLDDVFSELDVNRRVNLISGMTDAQIFITCTEREYIEKELQAIVKDGNMPRFFRVENGNVISE